MGTSKKEAAPRGNGAPLDEAGSGGDQSNGSSAKPPVAELKRIIPEELKQKRRWVGWTPDPKTKRPKCPVIISAKDHRASTRVPETWSGFADALAFYDKYADEKTIGIGYVFHQDDGLIYVDVDDALDAQGEVREWARPFVEPFVSRAYIETSPSGRGLHIIGRGKLPEGSGSGGKANFPQHATDLATKVPEVAVFAHGKYTTITGRVWKKNASLGEATKAVAQVWALAGIHATAFEGATVHAPEDNELPVVDQRKIPAAVKKELKDCTAANAEDRSSARFKLYTEAAQKLTPEEIFALVLEHDEWFQDSGAKEKGREHTWADIFRACAKADTAKKEFEAVTKQHAEEHKKSVVNWQSLGISVTVEMTKSGPVHRVVYGARNMAVMLARHPDWTGKLRLNQFKEHIELDGKKLEEEDTPAIAEAVRAYLGWNQEPQLQLVEKAVAVAARENAYHPVQQYLRSLSWDGVKRVDDWLERAGCEKGEVTRLVGRKWLISLVARALRPGCKVDTVLVLEGEQGRKKSSLLRAIAGPDNFTDASVTFDKDGQMIMHGHWIIELAELAIFQKAEQLRTKQFISGQDLTFRAPYGRYTVTRPRHFVLVGSTNDDEYFTDRTGNRRYWPVRVDAEKLKLELVTAERDQLLAEAVVALEAGEPWWFDVEPAALEAAREERLVRSPVDDKVAEHVKNNPGDEFTMATLLELLAYPNDRKDIQSLAASALREQGWRKRRRRVGPTQQWLWHDPLFHEDREPAEVRVLHGGAPGTPGNEAKR